MGAGSVRVEKKKAEVSPATVSELRVAGVGPHVQARVVAFAVALPCSDADCGGAVVLRRYRHARWAGNEGGAREGRGLARQ